jgi:hypothetical protein
MFGWHLWSRPAARLFARLAAAAAPELNVLGELCQHAHVDTVGMLRQDVPTSCCDLGDPALGPFEEQRLAMWVTAQAIRLAYRVVRPLGSGTCRSSSVTLRTCATLSRTSAEVCGRPSACSSSTGRIMDWKSGTVISVLVVDR